MKIKVVYMVLYFLLLLSWVFLAIKDQFHFPTFISLQNMTLISLLMIVTCLILGWMNYIKRKKRYQLVLMVIASALSFVYLYLLLM